MDSKNKPAPLATVTAPTTPSTSTPSTPPDLGSDSWESSKVSLQLAQLQKNEILEKDKSREKINQSSEKKKNMDKNKSSDASDKVKPGQARDKLGPKFSFRMFRMTGIFSSHNKVKKDSGNSFQFWMYCDTHCRRVCLSSSAKSKVPNLHFITVQMT